MAKKVSPVNMKTTRNVLYSALGVVGFVSLSGCSTVGTLSDAKTENKIYCGTTELIDHKCIGGACFDFPLSLIADTLLLPVTIPWTLINQPDNEQRITAPDSAAQKLKNGAAQPAVDLY